MVEVLDNEIKFQDFEVFPWHPSFDTGIELIDNQHKGLVLLLNKLAVTVAGGNLMEVDQYFGELAEYASTHFKDEEKIWSEYFGDDSWFTSHLQTHNNFLPAVTQIKESGGDANVQDILEKTVRFLIRWLAVHILENDKRMSFVVSNIDAGSSLEVAKLKADSEMSGSMLELVEAVLSMYENLSSTALHMIRERNARLKAEGRLLEAYKKLEAISITDQLTGLFNRRYFDTLMKKELARAARKKEQVAFCMIDVDLFKKYNDRYGHLAGDDALRKVAAALQVTCRRPGDFTFRYGGEEFCVLATAVNVDDAKSLAENIRESVESLAIPHADNENEQILTISVGVVSWIPSAVCKADDYISRADEALYKSKNSGRNRVTFLNKPV
jgi:diguanylate cyclase (GGDEF)-like protein/hemerythrin-like metal-binding protein